MKLPERCRIHAEKMHGEGWYVTANLLSEAADQIEAMQTRKWCTCIFAQCCSEPPLSASEAEDIAHDFDDHDCGEDTCVCRRP